jgi:hypothetical protein
MMKHTGSDVAILPERRGPDARRARVERHGVAVYQGPLYITQCSLQKW